MFWIRSESGNTALGDPTVSNLVILPDAHHTASHLPAHFEIPALFSLIPMSPSMPINIASSISASASTSSRASSPSSLSGSSSSSAVYVPVHRRIPSNVSRCGAREPKRTLLPIYTPAELMLLAQSPLAKELSAATHAALHEPEFSAIALGKRQQRSREYMQRKEEQEKLKSGVNIVVASRRRSVGRTAERSNNSRRNGASKFVDAASWRPTTRRMEALPVPLAV
ncbi:hypothetical protein B0H11DRAFT_2213437 [Mycena galericulata]|nr:hypothetical protein B0H11DRAFT_2213437 [Mycena galericulata]